MPVFKNRYLKVASQDLTTATTLVDRSGVAEWCEARFQQEIHGHKGGAHTQLTWRHLLIGLALVAMSEQPMILRDVVRTLNSLNSRQKVKLGLPRDITERMVSLRFNRFADLVDPSPYAHRNLERTAEMDEASSVGDRKWRKAGLEHVLDSILAASIPEDAAPSGSYAVDASGVPSWARQTAKWSHKPTATDPDAAWRSHMSTSTAYGKEEGQTPTFGGKAWYGYNLVAYVRVQNMGDPAHETGAYIERIDLTAANESEAQAAADLLCRMTNQTKTPPQDLVMDRAYTLGFDKYLITARSLGYSPHFDLRKDQRGLTGAVDGMLIVDGQPYSPSLPAALHDIPVPKLPGANKTQLAAWHAQHDQRSRYLIRWRGNLTSTGKMDFSCPASRDFSSLRCPNKSESMVTLPATIPMAPPIPNPTAALPKICAQQKVRVDAADLPLWQPYQYGTYKWWRSMARRARVEGAFGRLKNDASQNITRGRIRVMGLAKTSIMAAFLVAAANISSTARLNAAKAEAHGGFPPPMPSQRGPRARTTRLVEHRQQMEEKRKAKELLAQSASPSSGKQKRRKTSPAPPTPDMSADPF